MINRKIIIILIILSPIQLIAQTPEKLPGIEEWFYINKRIIDSTKSFTHVKPFEGEGFAALILPEKSYIKYFNPYNNYDGTFYISLWNLIDKNDSSSGFVSTQLSGSITAKIPKRKSSYEQDSSCEKIQYYTVVFRGFYKKLSLVTNEDYEPYKISIKNIKDEMSLPTKIFGGDYFRDPETKLDVIYFFIPNKMSDSSKYMISYYAPFAGSLFFVIHGDRSFGSLSDDWKDTVNIISVPNKCQVYKIPLYKYDLANYKDRNLFKDLTENDNRLTTKLLNFLTDPKAGYLLSTGLTDTYFVTREVNYIIFIRKDNFISPPLECRPGPNKVMSVKHEFKTP